MIRVEMLDFGLLLFVMLGFTRFRMYYGGLNN